MESIIAYQGVAGANSDLACRQAYPYMQSIAHPSFEDVFEAVENGEAKYGMIPIENSTAGRVAEIHNLLPKSSVFIIAEHVQKIEHHLLAVSGASLDDVREVYSHPQALMQCRNFIRKMEFEPKQFSNTAAAAEQIAKWGDKSKAAIASDLAGDLYGLEKIKANIEDSSDNVTIFIVISKEPADIDFNKDRVITSVLFTIRNIPAALYKSLGGFATNNVNMLKIESYIPGGVSAQAQFFASFEGHPDQKNVQLALEELGFFTKKVKVLGIYPADIKRFG